MPAVPGVLSVAFLFLFFSTYAGCDDLCQVYAECYISAYASCDDLCRVCIVLYFYPCQAVMTCAGYVDCYISTYASYDNL